MQQTHTTTNSIRNSTCIPTSSFQTIIVVLSQNKSLIKTSDYPIILVQWLTTTEKKLGAITNGKQQ
ncbi:hypothetical protein ACIQD3_06110 [Peribacillus loiseleuriae]|uniref:hypothetical protein n=1 Tax=Peribacillus loiseleuriae TaxID=1679170 RepID=UPI00382BE545